MSGPTLLPKMEPACFSSVKVTGNRRALARCSRRFRSLDDVVVIVPAVTHSSLVAIERSRSLHAIVPSSADPRRFTAAEQVLPASDRREVSRDRLRRRLAPTDSACSPSASRLRSTKGNKGRCRLDRSKFRTAARQRSRRSRCGHATSERSFPRDRAPLLRGYVVARENTEMTRIDRPMRIAAALGCSASMSDRVKRTARIARSGESIGLREIENEEAGAGIGRLNSLLAASLCCARRRRNPDGDGATQPRQRAESINPDARGREWEGRRGRE